ncbi:MAG: hypothetical protein LWW91_12645, partial [Bacteroidales bacterium]|nr:hypothetical protein [Bacteroidales bacterium]
PQESLRQLMALIDLTRRNLEKGITLTPGTRLKIYKSEVDRTADPVSAVMLHKGLRTATGNRVDVEMIPSDLHVFTRLRGRDRISSGDSARQLAVFREMKERMAN